MAGTAVPPVTTLVKADLNCSSVAAASVLAKVERDAMMVALAAEVGTYSWELNKGYSAPEHLAALSVHGPASTTAGRGGCPGCPGSRAASSRRTSRLTRTRRGRKVEAPAAAADEARRGPGRHGGGAGRGHGRGADRRAGGGDGSAVSDPPAMGDDERVWEVSVP